MMPKKKNNITTERRFEVTAKEGMGSGDPVIATFSFLGDASFYFVSERNDGRFDAVIRHRKQRKKKKKKCFGIEQKLNWREEKTVPRIPCCNAVQMISMLVHSHHQCPSKKKKRGKLGGRIWFIFGPHVC